MVWVLVMGYIALWMKVQLELFKIDNLLVYGWITLIWIKLPMLKEEL